MFTLNKRLIYSILGLVFLVFAACKPQSGSIPTTGERQTSEPQSALVNTKWILVSFSQQVSGEIPVVDSSTITLELGAEGQAIGSGGCNSYSAHYDVQGNTVSFGEITRTLMACDQEGVGQQEEVYIKALETAGKFELTGDHLTIWYDNGQGKLNFVKMQ